MDKQTTPVMMLFPIDKAQNFSDKYLFLGKFLSKLVFSLKYDLQKAEIGLDAERYCLASLVSATIYGFLFMFVGLAFGTIISKGITPFTLTLVFVFGFGSFISMLIFHLIYPKLAAVQIAGLVDQELLFALRTMLIQLSSGISLFESMKGISKSTYGQVSTEFAMVVRDVNSGMSETEALEKLAFKTKSEVLKKTIWQVITTMRSGGSIVNALSSQVDALVAQQVDAIKAYAAELTLWTLVYLIIAAALPSLGITFLVIASSIGGSGIGPEAVTLIVMLSLTVQVAMILLIRSKVPKVVK